jgi:predicted phage tail component-like protein
VESVCFDGVELTDFFTVLSNRGAAPVNVTTETVPGRDGVVPRGATLGCPQVSLKIICDPSDAGTLHEQRRRLASLLSARSARRLQFGNDGGLWYMAQPSGELDWSQFFRTGVLRVGFLVPSPAMYGKEVSVTVPSGGSVEFEVGGTYPTRPTIDAASAVRSSGTDGVWGVRLDGGDFVQVATGSSSACMVEVDCEARTCRVAGSVAGITLASDWLEFEPGAHVLRNDQGSGACTVTWRERWLA